ncbi:hypothetical protein [Cohnella cholangitidis]|uniref:Glycosyltransferase family 2 protein n=1 Tax=Cohnella cholangitidis TaxID=2598458 RepID=A0A7G5BUZ7_9BACL|nr:hypothetical protein [Cohnella cholangitidis]QMV40781.1 hypothetical protein FPL14_05860 [Cohnella cholangitidis]
MDNEQRSPGSSVSNIKQRLQRFDNTYAFNMQPIGIVFAISLKSKAVSRDWVTVQNNLAKTLRSILHSSDANFRIVIAGHEKPDIEELKHEYVTWLSVDFPPPKSFHEFSRDKMSKRKVIGAYLRKIGYTGYFMPLDADDWVHYRFVEFIRSQPYSDAFVLKKGLMVNLVKDEIWLRRGRFFASCGSSAVYFFSNSDYPLSAKKPLNKSPFLIVLNNHTRVLQHLAQHKKKHQMIDFPFITWVLAHGDNNSMLKGRRDNSISAKNYGATSEKFGDWLYDYFKIRGTKNDGSL